MSGLTPFALLPIVATAVATSGCTEGTSASLEIERYSIEAFMETTTHTGASFSPDGSKILLSHDGTGVFNVYSFPVDGGEPTQLTSSTDHATFAVSYFRHDERFLYTSDQAGNELNHVYVQAPDGTVTDLTPGDGLKAGFAGWARDGESFYLTSTERDPRFMDVYEVDVADGYARTMIYQNDEGYFPGGVSPDGRYLALIAPRTTNDNDLYLADLSTGQRIDVTPHAGDVSSSPADFSPDGTSFLYTTDQDSEFRHLVRHDLETGEKEVMVRPDWDVMFASYSRDGSYLVVGINADARTDLHVYDARTMQPLTLPTVPNATVTSATFSADEATMAFYASGDRYPRDLFVQSMSGDEPVRLTSSLNPTIDPEHLVDGEIVRFASYDGLEIPGILYKPHGASPTDPAPALVWVHGGPGGQSRIGYRDLIQYLVNHGYAIYAINNRGSSGYGKTFYAMDDRRHGEADLGDVVASKEMLIETGWIDAERIGILGGSYGGYMVVAALAFEPEVFDVGVDIFGVTNWLRTLENMPPWWEAQKEALYSEMGDPATDGDRLHRISPLFHASNITKPLIVLQGANDPRVLQVESDEIVEAVRANGVPVEYIVFPDEGHGFRNRDNQIRGYRAIREFLDEHLKGSAEVAEHFMDRAPAGSLTAGQGGTV